MSGYPLPHSSRKGSRQRDARLPFPYVAALRGCAKMERVLCGSIAETLSGVRAEASDLQPEHAIRDLTHLLHDCVRFYSRIRPPSALDYSTPMKYALQRLPAGRHGLPRQARLSHTS